MKEEISIKTKFITLGQFLKFANVFESGGIIKDFIQNEGVIVNGEREHRRGRKLYPGDVVEVEQVSTFIVTSADG